MDILGCFYKAEDLGDVLGEEARVVERWDGVRYDLDVYICEILKTR